MVDKITQDLENVNKGSSRLNRVFKVVTLIFFIVLFTVPTSYILHNESNLPWWVAVLFPLVTALVFLVFVFIGYKLACKSLDNEKPPSWW